MELIGGGKTAKCRGTSYEYRVRNWFCAHGWDAERNALSGASQQISDALGKHDVRAQKGRIFLQIECKKTGVREIHKVQREWFDKINFNNDEFLVLAFSKSPHYIMMPASIYKEVFPNFYLEQARYTIKGGTVFGLHRSWLDAEDPMTLFWEQYDTFYVITNLETFIPALEKRGPLQRLSFIDVIKMSKSAEELAAWYQNTRHRLTNYEKSLYYAKLHRLENNIVEDPSKDFVSSVQWWRDTSKDFVLQCPHCNATINREDVAEDKAEEQNNVEVVIEECEEDAVNIQQLASEEERQEQQRGQIRIEVEVRSGDDLEILPEAPQEVQQVKNENKQINIINTEEE